MTSKTVSKVHTPFPERRFSLIKMVANERKHTSVENLEKMCETLKCDQGKNDAESTYFHCTTWVV